MSTIDQQLVEYIVKSLVSKPDAVQVERRIDEKGVLLELTVDPEDLGRVIGKRGATAQSLRTLLRALGTKNDARYNLKIVDNGIGAPQQDQQQQPSAGPGDDASQSSSPTAPVDDVVADEPIAAPAADEPAASVPEAGLSVEHDQQHDDVGSQTRKELQEFDDLDV